MAGILGARSLRHAIIAAAAAWLAACPVAAAPSAAVEYANGRWWNGRDFAARSMWVVGDTLSLRRPPQVGSRVDLHGAFVTPPFIEGHNHWLEPARVDAYNACYLADGVFYVRDMANLPYVADQFRDRLNRPGMVDWTSAMMGFTGPGGHPVEIIDQFVGFGILPRDWRPDYDGEAMFVVTDQAGIERDLDRLAAQGSAIVKAFLLFSEHYSQSLADPATRGNGRGMDPRLLPGLVRSAHRRGMRVAAHIYSAADFRAAVAAGVDEIAHMPGTGFRTSVPPADFRITAADARAAARVGITVTTTLYWLGELREDDPAGYRVARDAIVVPNLRLLKAAGVQMLIGSDEFRHDVRTELGVLQGLGVFTRTELLTMNAATIRAAFPRRRLGALAEGYRADFIATRADPRRDLSATDDIMLRVKEGVPIPDARLALHRPSPACVEGAP